MTDPTTPPDSHGARSALSSIDAARRRRVAHAAPDWLHWSLGGCMVVEGTAYALEQPGRGAVQVLVLAAIFILSFAAQRASGVVARLARPPRRPMLAWIGFGAAVVSGVAIVELADDAGRAPLGCFVLAALLVGVGPRLNAIWRRAT